MEIRPPHKPNYPGIAGMLAEATELGLDTEALVGRVMADQHFDPNLVFMAREQGSVLGFLDTVFEGGTAWIKLLAVHPSRRRQGLGKEMLGRAEERLFGEGARRIRAGFGPGPLFYPGVPEEAAGFFEKLGFSKTEGGCTGILDVHSARQASPLQQAGDPKAAYILIEATSPLWWSEVEERFSFSKPRVAMSADGKALCLFEPGKSVGPLFFSNEGSAEEAVRGALAQGGPKLMDSRPPAWWTSRFRLKEAKAHFEFSKELTGEADA
jgi:GNAT superfamily N-acetyltransferase